LSLMVLFVKPGHCNTFKYTNLIYSGQQCAFAGMTYLAGMIYLAGMTH